MIKSTAAVSSAAVTSASRTMANNKVLFSGVALILLLVVNNSFAAPANSNEDQIGYGSSAASSSNRQAFRNREGNPQLLEYNYIPVVPQAGLPVEAPDAVPAVQTPMDLNILLNYLISRHYANNRPRLTNDLDSARNEYTRKRSSYSRYCAFNAVSCFGRKK